MINIQRTIELFGYNPDKLLPKSNKKVVHNCDDCGKERVVPKSTTTRKKFLYCRSCHKKGNRCNLYKDGRSIKQYYCKHPGCTKKICLTTATYGNGYCNLHSQMGKNHPRYIDGRSSLTNSLRSIEKYVTWRSDVFHRDQFICQSCGSKKSDTFQAHHKKPFKNILNEFLNFYSQFSVHEDKETLVRLSLSWKDFWDINNGVTLCERCHKQEHSLNLEDR